MLLISLVLSITVCICLNVIKLKNDIIFNQDKQIAKANSKISTYQKENTANQYIIGRQESELNKLTIDLNIAKDANKHLKDLGNFKITYYDLKYESCGKTPNDPNYGHTRSGVIVEPNVTLAVDTSIIPMGSYVYIDGIGCRVAQDTGSAIKGKHVDCYVNDFSYDKYKINQAEIYLIQ